MGGGICVDGGWREIDWDLMACLWCWTLELHGENGV